MLSGMADKPTNCFFAHKNMHLTNYTMMSIKSGLSDSFLSSCLVKFMYN